MLLIAILLLPLACEGDWAINYSNRWTYIKYVDMFFLMLVLSSVVMQSVGMGLRRDAGLKHGGLKGQPTGMWTRWTLRITGVILLYAAATLGYAYVIYDHIPISRNGGDYTTASKVSIVLRDDMTVRVGMAPKDLLQEKKAKGAVAQENGVYSIPDPVDYPCLKDLSQPCKGLIVLDQDSSYLYVTKADGLCRSSMNNDVHHFGPGMWRDGFEQRMGPFRPYVLAISLRHIGSVEDERH
jgi:hypothetical protein